MTDFESDSDHRPDEKPDDKDSPRKLELSGVQVAASALAAVSSAVAASYLGVGGTVLGAGVGSVIATISTALYQHSLHRTNAQLKKVVPVPNVVVRQTASRTRVPADPTDMPALVQDREAGLAHGVAAPTSRLDQDGRLASTGDGGKSTSPDTEGQLAGTDGTQAVESQGRRQPRWGRLALAAAVVFGVALGSIAVVEAFVGGSVSSVVRGEDPHGSTLGGLADRDDKGESKPDTPTSPTPTPTDLPNPTTSPTPDPEQPQPSPSASEEPTPEPTEVAPSESPLLNETTPAPGGGSGTPTG